MNNVLFCESFSFNEFFFTRYHYTDARYGCPMNYFGFMKSGHARLVSVREEIEVFPGDLFYIPLGCEYESFWYGEEIRFDSLGFHYFPQARDVRYPLQRIEALTGEEADLLRALGGGVRVDCASVGQLYALLACVLPRMTAESASPEQRLVRRALSCMAAEPSASMPEIAAACHVSQSALYAAFRSQGDDTPVHARQRQLVERAVQLLHTTDLPVEEISARLDFSSAAYFRRVLRRVTGKTPREIRRESDF